MLFHLLDSHAEYLSQPFQDRKFAFRSTELTGVSEQRSREDLAVSLLNTSLGELVGKEYVARNFPPAYKQTLEEFIGYLTDAYAERLQALDWMDEATRAEALDKLIRFTAEVGYPRQWHDYSGLEIRPDDLIGNLWRVQRHLLADAILRLDEAVRDWEWGYTPQTVNAYYSPAENKVVFMAGILQPPVYDPYADPVVNFGAIVAVIGHEVSHGFDDQGSQYDGGGLLRNWWTAGSREQFQARADRLVAQYSAFEPLPDHFVNGQLTLGENIGDLGGMASAYQAYRKCVEVNYGGEAPVLDGFSGDQRFFMAWARVWRAIPAVATGRPEQPRHGSRQRGCQEHRRLVRGVRCGTRRCLTPWFFYSNS